MHRKSISASALPQTPLGELTTPPDPLAGFGGPTSKGRGKNGRGGEKRGGEDFEIHEIWQVDSRGKALQFLPPDA